MPASIVSVTATGAGPSAIYTDTLGATTFVINYTGGGTHIFYWQALGEYQ